MIFMGLMKIGMGTSDEFSDLLDTYSIGNQPEERWAITDVDGMAGTGRGNHLASVKALGI